MPHGEIEVQCIAGRNIKDNDLFTKADPYLKVSVDQQNKRTKTNHKGGKTPAWNETLTFNCYDGINQIFIECWDEDAMSDDFIGRGTVSLSEVFAKGLHDSWFPILSKSGKPAGEVRLVVCFKSKVNPPQQIPTPVTPGQMAAAPPPYNPHAPVPVAIPQGYPPMVAPVHPPPMAAYPPQPAPGYPPQQAYPAPQPGYPPQQQPIYPAPPGQPQAYPPAGSPYPSMAPAPYPPTAGAPHSMSPHPAYPPTGAVPNSMAPNPYPGQMPSHSAPHGSTHGSHGGHGGHGKPHSDATIGGGLLAGAALIGGAALMGGTKLTKMAKKQMKKQMKAKMKSMPKEERKKYKLQMKQEQAYRRSTRKERRARGSDTEDSSSGSSSGSD